MNDVNIIAKNKFWGTLSLKTDISINIFLYWRRTFSWFSTWFCFMLTLPPPVSAPTPLPWPSLWSYVLSMIWCYEFRWQESQVQCEHEYTANTVNGRNVFKCGPASFSAAWQHHWGWGAWLSISVSTHNLDIMTRFKMLH